MRTLTKLIVTSLLFGGLSLFACDTCDAHTSNKKHECKTEECKKKCAAKKHECKTEDCKKKCAEKAAKKAHLKCDSCEKGK